jgi:hypothetical protein
MGSKSNGPVVRTRHEHIATERRAVAEQPVVRGMEVMRPDPLPHHKFEILIYEPQHGRFVHRKYVSSEREAREAMAIVRGLGHRAKHVRVTHAKRGPIGRRVGAHQHKHPKPSAKPNSGNRKRIIERTLPPELEALHKELRTLQRKLEVSTSGALPGSVSKCLELVTRLKAKLA